MRKIKIGTLIFIAVFTVSFMALNSPRAKALYNAGRLIDDSIFLNASSMSPEAIQSFLSSKGSGLTNATFTFNCTSTGSQSSQAYQVAGAPCGQTASAAQIIYYAAQIYGVNPRVVLATLQKEQSLITTPNPTSWQVNQAMGYGCPDSGGCGASNFLYQIDNGTWLLRFHMERARGNMNYWFTSTSWVCGSPKNYYKPSLYPGQNVSFYDDSNVLYTTIWLSNASSASMYCYTPHAYNNPQGLYGLPAVGSTGQYYSGSYNFVTYYERWFGSTLGSLWRTVDNGTLYYVDGKQKFIVNSMGIISQYGFDTQDIRYVSQAELDTVPLAIEPLSPVLGQLVKSSSDGDADGGTIYLIDSGRRIPISSMSTLTNYGYAATDISYLPLEDIQRLPASPVLSTFAQDQNYTMYQIENGRKRVFFELSKYNQVNTSGLMTKLSLFTLSRIGFGQPQIDGSYLIIGPDSTIRLYNGLGYSVLSSMDTYSCWGFGGMRTYRVSSYDQVNGNSLGTLSCIAQDSGGTSYLMNGSSKYNVSGYGLATSQTADDVIARANTASLPRALQAPNGEIAVFEGGKRRALPSMLTFWGLNLTAADIGKLSAGAYYALPVGSLKLAPSNLIIDGTGTVSVISASDNRYLVTSAQLFNDYGFGWGRLIRVTDSATLSAYPAASGLGRLVNVSGTAYLVDGANKYAIDASLYGGYGIGAVGSLQPLDASITSSAAPKNATRFLISSLGGTIYYLENGQKRPITSWQKFLDLGGIGSVLTVNNATLSLFPTGSTI